MTRFRHPVFTGAHLERMEQIMRNVCADFETEPAEFNGQAGHVHLLVNFPPKVALSKLVPSLKGVTSRRMRQEFPELARHHWRANKLWSASYFAGSVGGAPPTVLRQYIQQQNQPGQSKPGPGGPPAPALTPGPKTEALARTSVAGDAWPKPSRSGSKRMLDAAAAAIAARPGEDS